MVSSATWFLRILRVTCLAVLALVLMTLATIQFQQRLLRHRAELLMADMHQIHLYRSTWADAQRLMTKWGAWGHYDGTCTAGKCRYRITLTDVSDSKFGRWIIRDRGFRIYSLFGGRASRLVVSFTVQDGTIWRETAAIVVTASPRQLTLVDNFPTLIVQTKSRQRLRSSGDDWWILGTDDQLAAHPYYKADRPGGCTFCREAVVTYSTRTPSPEIDRLTSFNFSCLTQFFSCVELEQLLPAAKEWHLYHEDDSAMQQSIPLAKRCDIPIWVIARDTRYALLVEGLSSRNVKVPGFSFVGATNTITNGPDFDKTEARVKVLTALKGDPPWTKGTVVLAYPYEGTTEAAEHLFPRKRYIVFPVGDDRRDQVLTKESPIELNRCGVWDDTSENLHEAERGITQNDGLRETWDDSLKD
jgi:hypothetical protein